MKSARGITMVVLLAVCSVAGVSGAVAQNKCPYDATGDYTYDPAASPSYLFYGDGQITYDGSLPWYLDDTLACYNVYRDGRFLPYFPKCDIDGDGKVTIDEVYDIYFRVHPVGQGDAIAQTACAEAFEGGPFTFCHSSRYSRTASDIASIVAAYPAAEAIVDGNTEGYGHVPLIHLFDEMSCTTPGSFPTDLFESLNECYLATESGNADRSDVTVQFSQAVDISTVAQEYSNMAQRFGGICEPTPGWSAEENAPGFHYFKYDDAGWWFWKVRATEKCYPQYDVCICDNEYELWTHRDYPGQVWFESETKDNVSCWDLRFIDCDDTTDADGDGAPACVDECDHDETRTSAAGCGCNTEHADIGPNGPICCPWGDYENCWCLNGEDVDLNCAPPSVDADGDGVSACHQDECPYNASCSCDQCDNDALKTQPGVCGCGVYDMDADNDGVYTCEGDLCDNDPSKTVPGLCGCGTPDVDSDGDGIADCNEPCNGHDADGDTICDYDDPCPDDPTNSCWYANCTDLAGTDWGSCPPRPLGAGVVNGECLTIFGCEVPPGVVLFSNVAECQANCGCCASNSDCGVDEYCEFDLGSCGPTECGQCSWRPEACYQVYAPVCGCDGITYGNDCDAAAAGASIWYEGEC